MSYVDSSTSAWNIFARRSPKLVDVILTQAKSLNRSARSQTSSGALIFPTILGNSNCKIDQWTDLRECKGYNANNLFHWQHLMKTGMNSNIDI